MKFIHITVHFEYTDEIERRLDAVPVTRYACFPRAEGRDTTGKLDGTQVFPGNITVLQAIVEDDQVDRVLESLRQFRDERAGHKHLEAAVLPIEKRLE